MESWKSGKRFTLLEMIFVLACIVIVVIVLSQRLTRGSEKGNRVECAGNLKHIGVALFVYTEDYDNFFMTTPAGSSFEPLNTEGLLMNVKVFRCPSSEKRKVSFVDSHYFYAGSGIRTDDPTPTTTATAHDQSGNHPDNQWMDALFVDGHVEGAKPDGSKTWNTYGNGVVE